MSKLATSDSKRTSDSGHVTHMSPVRWERWREGRGAVQVQAGSSYWSTGLSRKYGGPSTRKLTTGDPTMNADSGYATTKSSAGWWR